MPFCFTPAKPSLRQSTEVYPVTCGFSHAKADTDDRARAMTSGFSNFFIQISVPGGYDTTLFCKHILAKQVYNLKK
ncbi:hypothetical protein [Moraxella lacunata]|uniref:hypothetical protein n=1 Tax=Moraxella lacunata TaxID=477 RepID=UPI003EDF02C4